MFITRLAIEKIHFQSRGCRHFPTERDRRGKTRFARLFGTGVRSRGRRVFPTIHWENALEAISAGWRSMRRQRRVRSPQITFFRTVFLA